MTNLGKDHYLKEPETPPPEEPLAQLETRLRELEVHCADLTTKLCTLEALLLGDTKDV